ncbi:MAG: ATP-binding protein [Acidimicrobiia bacterium]
MPRQPAVDRGSGLLDGSGGEDRLRIDAPARPGYLSAVRLFAAAVARHYRLPEAVVADLKLAVSESLNGVVEEDPSATMSMEALHSSNRLLIRLHGAGVGRELMESPDGLASGGLALVRALFEDARIDDGRPPILSFSVPRSAVGDPLA